MSSKREGLSAWAPPPRFDMNSIVVVVCFLSCWLLSVGCCEWEEEEGAEGEVGR